MPPDADLGKERPELSQRVSLLGPAAVRPAAHADLDQSISGVAKERRSSTLASPFSDGAVARGEASPFTGRQVDVARLYRTLVERHDAGGVRCIGMETRVGGGASGGGEFIDAFIDAGRQIERFRERIGSGVAMSVRRVRPSARGGATAGLILDRVLVDAICLQDKSFRRVLEDHGWACEGKRVAMLVDALGLSLNRMAGAVFKSS